MSSFRSHGYHVEMALPLTSLLHVRYVGHSERHSVAPLSILECPRPSGLFRHDKPAPSLISTTQVWMLFHAPMGILPSSQICLKVAISSWKILHSGKSKSKNIRTIQSFPSQVQVPSTSLTYSHLPPSWTRSPPSWIWEHVPLPKIYL